MTPTPFWAHAMRTDSGRPSRCLGQRTAIVAGSLLPAHAAVLGNQLLQVSVALGRRRLDRLAWHGTRPRRDDDPSIGIAFDDSAIDIRPIVGSVARSNL